MRSDIQLARSLRTTATTTMMMMMIIIIVSSVRSQIETFTCNQNTSRTSNSSQTQLVRFTVSQLFSALSSCRGSKLAPALLLVFSLVHASRILYLISTTTPLASLR